MQPDNQVQDPGFLQTFNKYAYVFNNPLSFTDPSGWAGGSGNYGNTDGVQVSNSVYASMYYGTGTSIIYGQNYYNTGNYTDPVYQTGPAGGNSTSTSGITAAVMSGMNNAPAVATRSAAKSSGRGGGGSHNYVLLMPASSEHIPVKKEDPYDGSYMKSGASYNYSGNGGSMQKMEDDIKYITFGVYANTGGPGGRFLELLIRDISAPSNAENVEALDEGLTAVFAMSPVRVNRSINFASLKLVNDNKKTVDLMKNWLGKDANVIVNKAGDKIFVSKDGLRKIRFDLINSQGDAAHVHIEIFSNGKWRDAIKGSHRIYPK